MKNLKLTLLFSLLTVLMVLIGGSIGGETGMVLAFLMAAALNFFSYWFSDRIVLKMYGATEIGPHDHPVPPSSPLIRLWARELPNWRPWRGGYEGRYSQEGETPVCCAGRIEYLTHMGRKNK